MRQNIKCSWMKSEHLDCVDLSFPMNMCVWTWYAPGLYRVGPVFLSASECSLSSSRMRRFVCS